MTVHVMIPASPVIWLPIQNYWLLSCSLETWTDHFQFLIWHRYQPAFPEDSWNLWPLSLVQVFSVVSNGVSLIYIALFWTRFIGTRKRLKLLCSWIWHPVTSNRRMDFVNTRIFCLIKTLRNTKLFEKDTNHITLFLRSVVCSRKKSAFHLMFFGH